MTPLIHIIDVRTVDGKYSLEATIEYPAQPTDFFKIIKDILSYETSDICCDIALDEIFTIEDIWFQGNIHHRRVIYKCEPEGNTKIRKRSISRTKVTPSEKK